MATVDDVPWDRLPASVRDAALQIADRTRNVQPPAYAAVWPRAADRDHQCMEHRIPKARHAERSGLQNLGADATSARYKVQEKFNGVFVVWDGDRLWTKTGHEVRPPATFRQYLPPSFALVGELYGGYGHGAFHVVTALAQNKVPKDSALGHTRELRHLRAWQGTRIVAFDVPGLEDQPYRVRYRLLC